jgi:hypothetical protein
MWGGSARAVCCDLHPYINRILNSYLKTRLNSLVSFNGLPVVPSKKGIFNMAFKIAKAGVENVEEIAELYVQSQFELLHPAKIPLWNYCSNSLALCFHFICVFWCLGLSVFTVGVDGW